MDLTIYITVSILVLIALIFALAKLPKKSNLQTVCKKITKILLGGIVTLTDEDRDLLVN